MVGEDHALLIDFPEYKQSILTLTETDTVFADKSKRYHQLDEQIRNLELANDPIGDDSMHQLKHERRVLKDELYHQLSVYPK